jgi:hypothetical protein
VSNEDVQGKGNGATSQRLKAQEVTVEEYKDLSRRVESMESSVELVVKKVKQKKFLFVY